MDLLIPEKSPWSHTSHNSGASFCSNLYLFGQRPLLHFVLWFQWCGPLRRTLQPHAKKFALTVFVVQRKCVFIYKGKPRWGLALLFISKTPLIIPTEAKCCPRVSPPDDNQPAHLCTLNIGASARYLWKPQPQKRACNHILFLFCFDKLRLQDNWSVLYCAKVNGEFLLYLIFHLWCVLFGMKRSECVGFLPRGGIALTSSGQDELDKDNQWFHKRFLMLITLINMPCWEKKVYFGIALKLYW